MGGMVLNKVLSWISIYLVSVHVYGCFVYMYVDIPRVPGTTHGGQKVMSLELEL